ncbi:hypothetical protein OGAPHI_001252 [Ogataea philodendri]|uniref:Brl1/Brr6 domain-containing protein n=1 Tax=Ogataea philodendri TaxID=1378263 RepID=A0A9P8PGB5_9ASCO|nr:uncharacterized protein OGAPHI_001252 [Ogataea philodendri]KAH3670737.1 hypothetical protein OGAPHI_001252 [Ogataea philodendri]
MSPSGSLDGDLRVDLTPVQNHMPHERREITETLRKAQLGQTLAPEKLNNNYNYLGSKDNSTPLSFASANKTPVSILKNSSLSPDRKSVSEDFVNSQPGLRMSKTQDGHLNPVKGAYNVFDKRFPTSGSPMNLTNRKRRRLSNTNPRPSLETNKSTILQQAAPKQQKSYSKLVYTLLSDPQCASNLTLVVQILLNTLVFVSFATMVLFSFLAIKHDADRKIQGYSNKLMHEISLCKREYFRNNCSPELRVPALEEPCNEWDNCMNRDPESVITTVAYFEIMADCMNAFFHNLSFRTLFGLILLILFLVLVPNVLFNKFRSSKTTTTNNYYTFNPDQSNANASQISQMSPLRSPTRSPQRILDSSVYFTPPAALLLRDDSAKVTGSSVRFDTNVSYHEIPGLEASPLSRWRPGKVLVEEEWLCLVYLDAEPSVSVPEGAVVVEIAVQIAFRLEECCFDISVAEAGRIVVKVVLLAQAWQPQEKQTTFGVFTGLCNRASPKDGKAESPPGTGRSLMEDGPRLDWDWTLAHEAVGGRAGMFSSSWAEAGAGDGVGTADTGSGEGCSSW